MKKFEIVLTCIITFLCEMYILRGFRGRQSEIELR